MKKLNHRSYDMMPVTLLDLKLKMCSYRFLSPEKHKNSKQEQNDHLRVCMPQFQALELRFLNTPLKSY